MAEKVKKEKSKARKIIEGIVLGVFGAACAFVLAANVSAMINKKKNFGQSIKFGVGTFVILTNSMEPEIHVNDFILTYKEDVAKFGERLSSGEKIDVTFMNIQSNASEFELETEEFKTGTPVVTNRVMTHRLREVHIDENKAVGDGHYIFIASGINAGGESSKEGQYQVFTEIEYLGTVKSVNSFMGRFMNFISSPIGLIILLLVPAAYLITVSSIDIFKAVKAQEEGEGGAAGSSNTKAVNVDSDRLSKISDEERARLKNELLEQMIKEKKEGKK
ncbi:MAG: hypothetical protein IKP50_04470 [Bacilli bacterium]|nr:hypothetical protein [Bacilli bacterium]